MRKRCYDRLKFIPVLIAVISLFIIGYNMVNKYQLPYDEIEPYDEMPYEYPEDKKEKQEDLIDLNRATKDELESLPEIGEATAEKILELRFDIGRFSDVSELLYINDIDIDEFEKILPYITVD